MKLFNIKNLMSKLSAVCLGLLIMCAQGAYAEGNTVKIGLYYGGSQRSEYTVSANEPLEVGAAEDNGFLKYFDISAKSVVIKKDSKYHIEYNSYQSAEEADFKVKEIVSAGGSAFPVYADGKFRVWGGSFDSEEEAQLAAQSNGAGAAFFRSGLLCAVNSETGDICYISEKLAVNSPGGRVTIKAVAPKEYRGAMLFSAAEGGISAVNAVDREGYLYSVISREMSPSWPREALKAQAVCARNYVENNRGKHSAYGFDLCDSVCCQAYGGTSAEAEGSYPPVDETENELLMYKGEVAQTFYSSSMGPTTEDVKYVWGSNFPYLTSVENPYEDYENVYNGKWEKTLTKERATEIMAAKGYKVGSVTEIKALEYSPSGRVIKLLVKGTEGEKIFERESCRIVFSDVTLSQLYTISGGGEVSYPSVAVMGENKAVLSSEGLAVLSAGGKTGISGGFKVKGAANTKSYNVTKGGDEYVFSGMGWGHGIGMSQYGAKGMAEAGFDYEEILTHYFKGTEVVKN